MKYLAHILGLALAAALLFGGALPASADWVENIITDPTIPDPDEPIPSAIQFPNEVFFFIPATSTTASSWLKIPNGANVEICLDNDVSSEAVNNSVIEVQLMFQPFSAGGKPTNTNYAGVLLGATLTGVPGAGLTNDCTRDVEGAGWVKAVVITADPTYDALLSIAHRNKRIPR